MSSVTFWVVFILSVFILVLFILSFPVICLRLMTPQSKIQLLSPQPSNNNDDLCTNTIMDYPDVDIVITWVELTPKLLKLREEYATSNTTSKPHFQSMVRYRIESQNELMYLLRSIDSFAPWIRKIHIVVSHNQRPSWMVEAHPKLNVVNDTEILPGDAIPTFNSHALEANIHKIQGLAEHYIYCNDDMMFANHVHPENFFTPDGKFKVIYNVGQPRPESLDTQSTHQSSWYNVFGLLDTQSETGDTVPVPQFIHSHQMVMVSKSAALLSERLFPQEYFETTHSRFRSMSDIHPLGLQTYMGILHKMGVGIPSNLVSSKNKKKYKEVFDSTPYKAISMFYVGWRMPPRFQIETLPQLKLLLSLKSNGKAPQLVCFNNIRPPNVSKWISFANAFYTTKSQYEK